MSTNTSPTLNSTDTRALELLGAGVSVAQTAAAIGVSESRIAQLLSEDTFAAALSEKRFESLHKHNARDSEYDAMEDTLLRQIKSVLPMVMDPLKLTRILQVVNAAKRRGASAPDSILQKQEVVKLSLPIHIVQRFSTNGLNQVVSIGGDDGGVQSMVTLQSGAMKALVGVRSTEQVILENRVIQDVESVRHEPSAEQRAKNLAKFGLD